MRGTASVAEFAPAGLVIAMATVLALAIPAAGADVKRPMPKSAGGKAGWVSQEYLKRHPDAIPGRPIPKRFLRPEEPATPKTALQCKDQVCTDVTGKRAT